MTIHCLIIYIHIYVSKKELGSYHIQTLCGDSGYPREGFKARKIMLVLAKRVQGENNNNNNNNNNNKNKNNSMFSK